MWKREEDSSPSRLFMGDRKKSSSGAGVECNSPSFQEIRTLPLIFPVDQELNREQVRIQHGNILEAVKNHDGDYAYFHMLVHCDWIYSTYKQYFDEFCR